MFETIDIVVEPAAAPPASRKTALPKRARGDRALIDWLKVQPISVTRHAAGLRPFTRAEFGTKDEAPTEGHIQAANALISSLRARLLRMTKRVNAASACAQHTPSTENLTRFVSMKDRTHEWVRLVEKVWDFYFELFGQRQTRFGAGC